VAAGAAALALGVLHQRVRAEVEALASEVVDLEASLAATEPRASSDLDRTVSARLRLALDAGAPGAVPPTAILGLVESALPENVVLESLSYGASPRPGLQLQVSTLDSDRVTELQRRLQAVPLVSTTSLLEERRLEGGRFAVRIQVDLEMP
jgi:hypothetical protein